MKCGRLRKNKEFRLVYERGQSYVGRYVVLYVLPNNKDEIRAGFTVGKKVGGSVQRNLVRRRLKEAYRHFKPDISSGCDLVLVARVRALGAKFHTLQNELGQLLNKARLRA